MMMTTKPIQFVQFGALSAEELVRLSVCEVKKPAKGNDANKIDLTNTPYDERMGSLENGKKCLTCGLNNIDCTGHFGHIKLERFVYDPKYIEVIYKILKSICISCGVAKISPDQFKFFGYEKFVRYKRLKIIAKKFETRYQKKVFCWSCKRQLFPIEKDKETDNIYIVKDTKILLTPNHVYEIFQLITNDTFKLLGFNSELSPNPVFSDKNLTMAPETTHIHEIRPESFIFVVFPVIPPRARPWVVRDGERHDDDLTEKYNSVIKANNKLRDESGSQRERRKLTEDEKVRVYTDLKFQIYTLIDNHKEHSGPGNSRRIYRGLDDRIRGKEGHAQMNVIGKRVDFSARSVIVGGGPYLRVGEVGVPRKIANILTKQELVIPSNIDELQTLVNNKEANYIIRNKKIINLEFATKNYTRPYGIKIRDIVERHLHDGDWVLFNRQPTLRIESMQGKKIKVLENEYVFRLPLAVTTPFNADFDGDEMNLHVPQSVSATTECATIMNTANMIVSAQNNSPIIGIVQDGLVASYILTSFDTTLKPNFFYDCVEYIGLSSTLEEFFTRAYVVYPEIFTKKKKVLKLNSRRKINGKVLLSVLFPPDFNYEKEEDGKFVKIITGIIQPDSAPFTRKIIGSRQNSVIHMLWIEYGPSLCLNFITNLQFLTDKWFPSHGFSVGISDFLLTEREELNKLFNEMDQKYNEILLSSRSSFIKEDDLNRLLNSTMNGSMSIAKKSINKGDKNSLNIMRNCGAKGSLINLTQICMFVGQQNIDNKRLPKEISMGRRCLPHFEIDENTPESRGFIYGNYLSGLNPTEQFMHAESGRKGIIDTHIKTADTGYIQKRMAKKLEDLTVYLDGSVRDNNGRIVQFLYGDDGFNPRKLFFIKNISFPIFANPQRIADILINENSSEDTRILAPNEIDMIFSLLLTGHPESQTQITRRTNEILKKVYTNILKDVKIPVNKIPNFARKMMDMFYNAKSSYGESVGLVATSSIGEPTTQMTLNTFHSTGISAKDVTLGVPRLNELINATRENSTPSCTIYLDIEELKILASKIRDNINDEESKKKYLEILHSKRQYFEHVSIGDFIDDYDLYFVPIPSTGQSLDQSPITLIRYTQYEEKWWGKMYVDISDEEYNIPEYWVVRLHFNLEKLYKRNILLEDICKAIRKSHEINFSCIPSPLSLSTIEIRVNFPSVAQYVRQKQPSFYNTPFVQEKSLYFFLARDIVVNFVKKIRMGGIDKITEVIPDENKMTREWMLYSKGSNFLNVLNIDFVDFTRTTTNNIWEILDVLGIEATRQTLISELSALISFDGTYINARHIELLVDAMTYTGEITSVRQDGIGREVGPISKGMFEKATENFAEASAFGEVDFLDSLSSNITLGTTAQLGTGVVQAKGCGSV